jgi:trans-aconitate 2-methyltransferase
MAWDPSQYERFVGERRRPFLDLLDRVAATSPRRVVDLGCGTGSTTLLLANRWPDAAIEGIDSSREMIAAAPARAGLTFRVGDVASWLPDDGVDVIVSNAALHWLPTHRTLVAQWAAALPAAGWLAFQVPSNFDAPSHTAVRALASSPRWAKSLAGVLRQGAAVATRDEYAALEWIMLRFGGSGDQNAT